MYFAIFLRRARTGSFADGVAGDGVAGDVLARDGDDGATQGPADAAVGNDDAVMLNGGEPTVDADGQVFVAFAA